MSISTKSAGNQKRNPFLLRNFSKIEPEYINRLESVGIKKAEQMLSYGADHGRRRIIALMAEIPEEAVLELVRLSDLSRLPGVKGIRARLYHDAGVDCVEKLAAYEPERLLALTGEFVKRTGFDGIAPLPKEVSSTIENARKLPKIVEW